jgi:hypothetical protein
MTCRGLSVDSLRGVVVELGLLRELYTVEGLQRCLFELGYSVPMDDLYTALKAAGWIKLRLIRDRLLETKRGIPKRDPYAGLRHLVKWPLGVSRHADLPGWDGRAPCGGGSFSPPPEDQSLGICPAEEER